MNAAFANAVLFHAQVQDDTHCTSHLKAETEWRELLELICLRRAT